MIVFSKLGASFFLYGRIPAYSELTFLAYVEAQETYRLDDEIELRTLNDGRTFRIVKRYDDPKDLASRLERAGVEARVGVSGEQFLYALAFAR